MLLAAHHGAFICGPTLAVAFDQAYFLEQGQFKFHFQILLYNYIILTKKNYDLKYMIHNTVMSHNV